VDARDAEPTEASSSDVDSSSEPSSITPPRSPNLLAMVFCYGGEIGEENGTEG